MVDILSLRSIPMISTSYTQAHDHLTTLCDKAVKDGETVVISRECGENVVLISESTWNSIQETMLLLSDGNRRERLEKSLKEKTGRAFYSFDGVGTLRQIASAHADA